MKNEIYHRELNWTEQITMALHVFSAIFGSFLKVLLFIFLPISLLESVILERMTQTQLWLLNVEENAAVGQTQLQEMLQMLTNLMTQEFLLYAVAMFLQPVGTIAVAKMVKQYMDGEKVQAGKAISESLNHMPAILITGFLYGALVLLGSFVIVPGIYFGIAWGLYACSIAFEEKKGWDALRSSKVLVQGKWWRTLGYLLLLSCVAFLWNSVFELICSFFGEGMMPNMIYRFLCYISVGFVAVGECLLYLNRKAAAGGACLFGRDSVSAYTTKAEDVTAEERPDAEEEERAADFPEGRKDENENK